MCKIYTFRAIFVSMIILWLQINAVDAEVDTEVDGVMQLRVIWLIGGQRVIFVLILAENCVFVASLDPITNSSMVGCFFWLQLA